MKHLVVAMALGLAGLGVQVQTAEALPCLDGIKTYCDGPPALSWEDLIGMIYR